MFGLALRVVTSGGEEEVQVSPKVVVAFEREFQTGLGRAFQNDQRAEHMFWLAWKASGSNKTFDVWLDDVQDVEMVTDVERPLSGTP